MLALKESTGLQKYGKQNTYDNMIALVNPIQVPYSEMLVGLGRISYSISFRYEEVVELKNPAELAALRGQTKISIKTFFIARAEKIVTLHNYKCHIYFAEM